MTDLATTATLLVVGMSILLMLVRPRGIARSGGWAAARSSSSFCGSFRYAPAGAAVAKGSDVYFFLIGMMTLSELAKEHGVFEWVSSLAVRSAKRSRTRLFTTVYAIGTLVTIFMSNDATAVVLTPAILAAVKKSKVEPLPYLFACAIIANAASFVLPISNPANLVVYRGAMPTLGAWLLAFGLPSLLSIATTYAVLRLVFRRELAAAMDGDVEVVPLGRSGRWVVGGLGLVVVVLLGASAFDIDLGLPTLVAALVVSAVVSAAARKNPLPLARNVSWSTLVLVAGLFVLVEAIENVGGLEVTRHWLTWASSLPRAPGMLVASFFVGIGNNVVNNLPLGLVAGATLQSGHPSASLQHAVLIGVDLGPNLAVTGSLATILWLLALRKEKIDVTFWQFFKVGVLVMPSALLASVVGALLTGGQ